MTKSLVNVLYEIVAKELDGHKNTWSNKEAYDEIIRPKLKSLIKKDA